MELDERILYHVYAFMPPAAIVQQMLIDADLWRKFSVGDIPYLWPDCQIWLHYDTVSIALDRLAAQTGYDAWLVDDDQAIHFVRHAPRFLIDTQAMARGKAYLRLKYRGGKPIVQVRGLRQLPPPMEMSYVTQQLMDGIGGHETLIQTQYLPFIPQTLHYRYVVDWRDAQGAHWRECEDYELEPVQPVLIHRCGEMKAVLNKGEQPILCPWCHNDLLRPLAAASRDEQEQVFSIEQEQVMIARVYEDQVSVLPSLAMVIREIENVQRERED